MKKAVALCLVFILLCSVFVGCGNTEPSADNPKSNETEKKNEISSIVLSTNTAEIKIGEEMSLSYIVLPESEAKATITWKSANDNIATVDSNGKIVGVAIGQTNIIASAENGVNDICAVTVIDLSPYEKMNDTERDFADVMLKSLQYFKNPKTVSVTYAYYYKVTDSWSVTISAQNSMGGNTVEDYDLDRNGKITKSLLPHVKTGLDSRYDLDLINEYISDYANR